MTVATASFSRLFGQPIDLWIFEQGSWWHAIEPCGGDLKPGLLEVGVILPQNLPLLPAVVRNPVVIELTSGICLIGVPLMLPPIPEAPGQPGVFALGTVETTWYALVSSILHLSNEQTVLRREVDEARKGLAPHLEQISSNFEELTWLRQMNLRLDDCDVGSSVAELAQRILPDLCTLTKAEGIVFAMAGRNRRSAIPGAEPITGQLVRSGACSLNDARCTNLFESLRQEGPDGHPLVLNQSEFRKRYDQFREIHSCIHIPVVHHGKCFGWLLALNRNPGSLPGDRSKDTVPIALLDDEFGTFEASLMLAAAGSLAAHAHNAALFREKELLLIGIIRTLINAIDAKDAYTCGHSDRVAVMAKCIGEQMGLDSRECERLYMAGLLHDLGKIGVPDSVLKKPGKLTEEEFAAVRQHPEIGHAILNDLPQIGYVLPAVLHHHEAVSGGGYPHGLRGEEIPLSGRILAVADAYDAMTSCRPYRTAMSREKANAILVEGAGTQWDARVVQAFLDCAPSIAKACSDADNHLLNLLKAESAPRTAQTDGHLDAIAQAVSLSATDFDGLAGAG